MKRLARVIVSITLALTLALGICTVPTEAAKAKGLIAPLTVKDGWGSSTVSYWLGPDAYTTDFSSYKISGDVYVPASFFKNRDIVLSLNAELNFYQESSNTSFYLNSQREFRLIYDENIKDYYFWAWDDEKQTDATVPYVKSVKKVGDMVKIQIVDESLLTTPSSNDVDESTNSFKPYTGDIPESGMDVNAQFRLSTDQKFSGQFAVANVKVKAGGKVATPDYKSEVAIGQVKDEKGETIDLKPTAFNTSLLSVSKTSVQVKAKKSASVSVSTMLSGDKVKVSTSAKKIATATYKNGKLTIKGLKKGSAVISVKANGKTKKIKVTVV